jgi:transcription antitermination protein NusB
MRVESRGRARALQAIYAWDVRGERALDRVASRVWDDLGVDADERQFASQIVGTLVSDGLEIDRALAEVTSNWRLERIGAIERSVLRLAAAELERGTTPVRVVIREAVRLAERYGAGDSARFVNGVLDAYARRAGRL